MLTTCGHQKRAEPTIITFCLHMCLYTALGDAKWWAELSTLSRRLGPWADSLKAQPFSFQCILCLGAFNQREQQYHQNYTTAVFTICMHEPPKAEKEHPTASFCHRNPASDYLHFAWLSWFTVLQCEVDPHAPACMPSKHNRIQNL